MPIEVKMAKLSPTMESGQLVKWLVKVGDKVKEGDTLAEIQTDKAVMPMEAFDEGTVARLDVNEGDEIALGQRVLVLAKKGEDPAAVAKQLEQAGGAGKAEESVAVRKDFDTQEQTNVPNRPEPAAPRTHPTEPGQPRLPIPAEATRLGGNGQKAAPQVAPGGRVKSSPLARKIAAAAQVDIAQIPGSGPGGRVIRRDVEAYLQSRQAE
ncbi:MAG: E3 binding domain-containing protein, partial [Isosphaeraceae bacterium]|nr:E3 binding domain-containing protein [Isosphaeraceae bacterium]